MTKSNPILKTLKVGDVVLLSMPGNHFSMNPPIRQIIKLTKAEYEKPNENGLDWLNFDGEVLYTTQRVHPSEPNLIFGNCLAISEKLNDFLVQKYKIDYMMFAPNENVLSDEELEYLNNRLS
jgi:hypothetical protein